MTTMSRAARKTLRTLSGDGNVAEALSAESLIRWRSQWRAAYLPANLGATRKAAEFEWQLFSLGAYPALRRDDAWNQYRRVPRGNYLVLGACCSEDFGFDFHGLPPMKLQGLDLLVVPKSMQWTMAFDHEDLGPYFAEYQRG